MLLLKHVDGLEIAEKALFIPRITGVMDLFVSPFIGEEDLSRIGSDVGERIKNMSGAVSQSLAFQRRGLDTDVRSSVGIREGGYFRP